MMYRMIIADDEEIERKAFRLFVNKNFPNIEVLEEAANGIELVEKANLLKPDLIVADINMPGFNGLDSIKMLKQKGLAARIIIHTAYSYFDYAQEALFLGADGYLLKPVKREKLFSVIMDCISKMEQERKKENEYKRLEKIVSGISQVIETDFMYSMLTRGSDFENLSLYLEALGINFAAGYIMTLRLPDFDTFIEDIRRNDINLIKKQILSLIKIEVKNICNCVISPVINNRIIMFIPINEDMTLNTFKIWSLELAEFIVGRVKKELNLELKVGIGQLCKELEKLPDSYEESIIAVRNTDSNEKKDYFYDVKEKGNINNPSLCFKEELKGWTASGITDNYNEMVKKLLTEIEAVHEIDTVMNMVLSFATMLNKELSEKNIVSDNDYSHIRTDFAEISNMNSKAELKLWLAKFVHETINTFTANKKRKINSFVKKSIDFIEKNYNLDISLENVAENIGVSPYYLSHLFKQELNKNFVEYLTNVRIKNAQKLIKSGDYSIKELSRMVGYANVTYFCKVFKKSTGKTIGKFKEEISD